MEITLAQGIILSLIVLILAWDSRWECFFLFRPIVISFITGIVLGDIKTGLAAGAIAELTYLGLTTVGGTVPPNPLIAGVMTTVLAYKNGISAEAALGLSLPFALLMQWIVMFCQSIFSGANAQMEKAVSEKNFKRFVFWIFGPEALLTFFYALVTFLSVYALQNKIEAFVNSFPAFLTHGFEIAGGILPAVGLALLLKIMVKKDNVPYLVIGFILMSVLTLHNILPIAICAMAIAAIGYMKSDNSKDKAVTVESGEEGEYEDGI